MRQFECSGWPVFGPNNEFRGFRCIDRDISERGAAATENVAKLAEARSDLLAQMAHELRHLLSGFAETSDLLMASELKPEQRGLLETLARAHSHFTAVMESALERAKIEGEKATARVVEFSLTNVLEGALGQLGAEAQRKGLVIQTQVAPDVPKALLGDPAALARVLTRLTANALRFTERGSIGLRVSNEGETAFSVVLRFDVQDNGPGMTAEAIRQMYEPAPPRARAGLSISREMITAMGGELCVDSRLGKGSTFWFMVPFSKRSAAGRVDA